MDLQLAGLQSMMAVNTKWLAEVAASPMTMPASVADTIVDYEAFEDIHPYPRMIIRPGQWSFDFHMGNCLSGITVMTTIDLIRAYPADSAAVVAQHREVCGAFREILEGLSQQSYGSGAQLAQLVIETVEPPELSSLEETPIDNSGTQYGNWYLNLLLTSKSS